MKTQKGFTIIELIVVIAIIAVLATIVMINVTQYIAKGKDASIKGNMASITTSAAAYYDSQSPNSFTNMQNNPVIIAANTQINKASRGQNYLSVNDTNWCACANLVGVSANYYCVDSTGLKEDAVGDCEATTLCDTAQTCH
jgi:prepilin-type N-terminal cleavage/methylation domain-containing protein